MQETNLFIPVGFKFSPSDEQLLEYYLYNKVSGIPIPFVDYIVKECDLYGKQEPRQIWESYGGTLLKDDDDLYFFTQLKKKTSKGSRIDRKVGSGTWQGEDAPNDIVSSKSQKAIGSKKRFRFEKEGSEENGCWIMHEYSLHPSLSGKNQSTHYVLCRIRKNQPTGTGTGKNKKSGLGKKRKLQDLKNSNQSVEPNRVFTNEEHKDAVCMNNGECQSPESSMLMMGQQEKSFQTRESSGMDCSGVAGSGQYEIPLSFQTREAVPGQSTQTLPMVQSARPEKTITQQQNQLPICAHDYEAALAMKRQKISSGDDHNFQGGETGGIDSRESAGQGNDDDPFTGISCEDNCLLCKLFYEDPAGENVDWESMPRMKEMLSDLPDLLSEEYVFVPSDDGESAGNRSCSVDRILKEKNLYDHRGEGVHRRSETMAYSPMRLPDQTLVCL